MAAVETSHHNTSPIIVDNLLSRGFTPVSNILALSPFPYFRDGKKKETILVNDPFNRNITSLLPRTHLVDEEASISNYKYLPRSLCRAARYI